MKISLSLCLVLIAFWVTSCSITIVENKAAPANSGIGKTADNQSTTVSNESLEPVKNESSTNPRDAVLFDGKNYIKKSGWKTPSKNATYIDESYDQGDVVRMTESGKEVRTNTTLYGYRTPWLPSQDFYYEGRELDYLKGKLESLSFLEISVDGKVFMYSISVEKVVTPSSSNNEDHVDPFGYRIQDRNGDGIFETLLRPGVDIVIPDWVLR